MHIQPLRGVSTVCSLEEIITSCRQSCEVGLNFAVGCSGHHPESVRLDLHSEDGLHLYKSGIEMHALDN